MVLETRLESIAGVVLEAAQVSMPCIVAADDGLEEPEMVLCMDCIVAQVVLVILLVNDVGIDIALEAYPSVYVDENRAGKELVTLHDCTSRGAQELAMPQYCMNHDEMVCLTLHHCRIHAGKESPWLRCKSYVAKEYRPLHC